MNINDLTLGQIKELARFLPQTSAQSESNGLCEQLGEQVIIRTYTAGVFFGTLEKKSGDEVILVDARRMWSWHAKKSISLSAVAIYGIDQKKSRIAAPINKIWLQAIEIISLSEEAIKSINDAPETEQS